MPCAASPPPSPRKPKPTTQASPLLFDLTSLQREANGRFGFSAKTTLSIAQSLYERHKALTYPRTDSRALPRGLPAGRAPDLRDAGQEQHGPSRAHTRAPPSTVDYIKPTKRVFDNAKVSDHFAIIPTLEAPKGLSEAEQKLYDLVARRFMAVFFPSAEYLVTTRISRAPRTQLQDARARCSSAPGWLAIYGKEAQDERLEGHPEPGARQARANPCASTSADTEGAEDPSAGPILGSDAARRDGRRRASSSKTTSCARRCRRRDSARRPPAPRSSKVCSTRSTCSVTVAS